MILVSSLLVQAPVRETMVPVHAGQNLFSAVHAGESFRHLGSHPGKNRCAEQKLLNFTVCILKDFTGKIVKHLFRGELTEKLRIDVLDFRSFQKKEQAGNPTVGLFVKIVNEFFRIGSSAQQADHILHLLRLKTKLAPAYHIENIARPGPGQDRWWFCSAQYEDICLIRNDGQGVANDFVEERIRQGFLIAIQNKQSRFL